MPEAVRGGRARQTVEPLIAAGALILFALFSHRGWPWIIVAAAGLLAAAIVIQRSLESMREAARVLGLSAFPRKAGFLIPVSCAVGIGLGILYRSSLALPIFPQEIQPFVAVACLIGGAEEIVYRGWMQGRLRVLGWPAAVALAAAFHTAYKGALFVWPSMPISIDFPFISLWTIAGGSSSGFCGNCRRAWFPHASAM